MSSVIFPCECECGNKAVIELDARRVIVAFYESKGPRIGMIFSPEQALEFAYAITKAALEARRWG